MCNQTQSKQYLKLFENNIIKFISVDAIINNFTRKKNNYISTP